MGERYAGPGVEQTVGTVRADTPLDSACEAAANASGRMEDLLSCLGENLGRTVGPVPPIPGQEDKPESAVCPCKLGVLAETLMGLHRQLDAFERMIEHINRNL